MFWALTLAGCPAADEGSDAGGEGSEGSGAATSDDDDDDDDGTADGGTGGPDDDDDDDADDDDDDDDDNDDGTGADDDDDDSNDDDDDDSNDDDDDDNTPGDPSTALHVSALGQDSNPGTPDEPMRTIQWALHQAAMNSEIESIRVAGGTYEADVANDAAIVMLDGVSMYGGWNEDFSARDTEAWTSSIVDSSAEEPASLEVDPARVVEIPTNVGESTVLDGFRIEVGLGLFRSALYIGGDAVISGNEIVAGGLTDAVVASAIHVELGSPQIVGNRVALDYDDEVSFLRAVVIEGATPIVANNIITANGGSSGRYVIWLSNAGGSIVGNSMVLAEGFNATLIRLQVDSAPAIENNLLQAGGSGGEACISSLTSGSVPSSLRNNLLQCGFVIQANGESPLSTWTSIADLHAGMPGQAAGNVKLASPLVGVEDGLDDTAPCTVARGGLDLTAVYPEDFAGDPRTDPVSMGAAEWDGDCQ